jgi:hypothetical protein
MFKCIFGHKTKITHEARQTVSDDNGYVGTNVYYVRKCVKCDKEDAYVINYRYKKEKLHPEYVKSLIDYCKKE